LIRGKSAGEGMPPVMTVEEVFGGGMYGMRIFVLMAVFRKSDIFSV